VIFTRKILTLGINAVLALAMNDLVRAQALPESSEYSAGMSAYMSDDFELAKTYWLNAAQADDGRAMFNLGLLHERQKVEGASDQRAEQWFQQAGNAGYAPADYHLALRLLDQGQSAEAARLLRRAADRGFILAQERLGIDPVAQGISNKEPSVDNGFTVDNTAQPEANVALPRYYREDWILTQPPESWTIQMLAFSDEAKVRNFIDDHGLHRQAAYFAESKGDQVIYKLIYGAYQSKQEADNARAGFTSALKEHGPWLRPIKAVQAIIGPVE